MEKLEIKTKVLSENQRIAEGLREQFRANGVLVLNFISSPAPEKLSFSSVPSVRFLQRRALQYSPAIFKPTTMPSALHAQAFRCVKSLPVEPATSTAA